MVFIRADDVPYVPANTYYSISDDEIKFVNKSYVFGSDRFTKHVLIYKNGTSILFMR